MSEHVINFNQYCKQKKERKEELMAQKLEAGFLVGSGYQSSLPRLLLLWSALLSESSGFVCFLFFAVLELELRAYTLSPSTSPIFVKGFSK
jgi:hypothetical protein